MNEPEPDEPTPEERIAQLEAHVAELRDTLTWAGVQIGVQAALVQRLIGQPSFLPEAAAMLAKLDAGAMLYVPAPDQEVDQASDMLRKFLTNALQIPS